MEGSLNQPGPTHDGQQPESQEMLSQGQGDRFDRWVEFLSAIVLSLATVLTAWCGYQASLWGGEQTAGYTEAAAARTGAAQQQSAAMLRGSIHVGLFTDYASALVEGNDELANFFYTRFPKELKVATDAWLATDPLNTPTAPLSPFDMAEYQLPERVEAKRLEEVALQKTEEAEAANSLGDRYMLLTVIFATTLFFAGISGKFQWRVIDMAMLVMGALVVTGGLLILLRSPMR